MPLDPSTLVLIALAYTVAALVKGTTGLGFSSVCVPLLVLVVGLPVALPLVIIPSLASNVQVIAGAGHVRACLARFWPLYVAGVAGIGTGLWILDGIDVVWAERILGAVLIAYVAVGRSALRLTMGATAQRRLAPAIGFATGTINGVTGSQVMPVLPYLLALRLDPDRFVTAINLSFTASSLAMAVGLSGLGLMTPVTAAVSAAGLVVVVAGIALGTRVRRRLSANGFRRAVLVVLLVVGLTLILPIR